MIGVMQDRLSIHAGPEGQYSGPTAATHDYFQKKIQNFEKKKCLQKCSLFILKKYIYWKNPLF